MIFVSGQLLEELLRSLAAGDPDSLARMKSHLECLRGDEPYIDRVSEVTRQLIERDAHGQRKYGTSLDRTDLTLGDWLQHQAEELMDGAGYALAAKREYEKLVAERDELRARLDSTGIVTHAPIFVSKTQALEWRKEWMGDHPAAEGEDHVTPFDGLLYQHVPYDQHTQRLRGAVSNIKWSEVPLDKLEAIAAVLCEYAP